MSYKNNFFNKKQTDKAYDKLVAREIANFKGKLVATGEMNELYATRLK